MTSQILGNVIGSFIILCIFILCVAVSVTSYQIKKLRKTHDEKEEYDVE